MPEIIASVGRGGTNQRGDVETVQRLLNGHIEALRPMLPLDDDGACGRKTVAAIDSFQSKVVGLSRSDGRVDPCGRTLAALNGNAPGLPQPAPAPSTTERFPGFQSLWDCFPREQAPCNQNWDNQCAIRMSLALEVGGFDLTSYTEPKCRHGHARGAESLANFLWRRVRRPTISGSPSLGKTRTLGKTGILLFRNITGFRGGQGDHIDLWNGSTTKTGEYFNESAQTWFWEIA